MDDDLFEFEAAQEAAPELVLGKKKKKKKKKKIDGVSAEESGPATASNGYEHASAPLGELSYADENITPQDGRTVDALGALDINDDGGAPDDSEGLAPPTLAKKKKKRKQPVVHVASVEMDSGLDAEPEQMDEPEAKTESLDMSERKRGAGQDPELEPKLETAETKRPMTAAEKKKAKKERERLAKLEKSKKEEQELNAILAELGDGPSADAAVQPTPDAGAAVPMTAAQKKRAKKKKKAMAEKTGDSDSDPLLAEVTLDPEPKAEESAEVVGGVDDLLAELAGGDPTVAKKKPKKKKKKGLAKEEEGDADNSEVAASVTSTDAKKPKKKESVAVRKMREQREKMLAEEQRLRKQEEEEEMRLAEEERLRQEAEAKKEEEKARKKAADKAKKDRKRKEGTLLTKAQKERKRKADLFREQMLQQGMIPPPTSSQVIEEPVRASYGKRRKPRQSTQAEEQESADSREAGLVNNDAPKLDVDESQGPETAQDPEVVPDAWDAVPSSDGEEREGTFQSKGEAGANGDARGNEEGDNDKRGSDDSDDSDSDSDSDYEGMTKAEIAAEKRLDAIRKQRGRLKADALAGRTADHLRSPVICILGHVDTGKTKILDRIRRTNVQDGEAGGITQQIGATYFPIDAVKKEATKLFEGRKLDYNVPSLLIIDTPGHESFTNLRSRGSSLCDIAILVVDIMHGLEPQTRESIDLLKLRKTPFIVALNKIDRIYDWDPQPHNCPTRDTIERQATHAQEEFMRRVRETKVEFAEIGFNTELYWDNADVRKIVSIVPTSAISGEGIPDLLMLLLALPQRLLTDRLMFNPILEATVLEVKVIEGLGTTIDIILTGGTIKEGNTIMVVGLDGPIVATIRALLTPHPMKEMRVKGQYLHHKEIKAAQGIKVSADGLEKAVAGTQLMVVEDPSNEDEMEFVREEVMKDFETILTNVDKSGLGVYVQASTLGSLEALLEFLRTSKIPVSGINIGPVHKRDVTKASTMLEKRKEFATILAFDVSVEREARDLADDAGVRIFTADIIYHLFDQFTAYMEETKKQRREEVNDDVVFPSICKILPQHIYNKKDPIVLGVDVMDGILRVGTPLVVRHGDSWLDVGRVASIELNKKQVVTARKGESVAVKIQHKNTEHIMYGRHFDFQDALISKMTRSAIDLLKENFRDDLTTEDWRLVVKLKKMFDII